MGLKTKEWGPAMWITLHSTAHNYPLNPTDNDKRIYKAFYENLQYTLPCPLCTDSYKQFIKDIQIDPFLKTRGHLILWVWLIHNKVNDKLRRQGNPVPPDPSFEDVFARYEAMRAT